MSSLNISNNKNKIIEKKIVLKKKNKSALSQDSFNDKEKLGTKFPSTFTRINMSKIDETDEKELTNELNKIQLYQNQNNINYRKNLISTDEINNTVVKRNRNKSSEIIKYNDKNDLYTPIKKNHYKYNISTNTKNESMTKNTYNGNSFITRNSTAENSKQSNNNNLNNLNNYIELNPISSLYDKYEKINDYYINNNISMQEYNKVNTVTHFNEYPHVIDSNKLKNYSKISNQSPNEFRENDLSDEIENEKSDGVDSQNNITNNYFNIDINDSAINRNSHQAKNSQKNENENDEKNLQITLNKKNSFINNNLYVEPKNKNNGANLKHVFVHRRRLSSFLMNDQNVKNIRGNNEKEKEKEINNSKYKYVYKRASKSFSCVNLKEKINTERHNISKSKRKSKIIDLNLGNEFSSMEKDEHKGGKIDLFNNKKISSFRLFQESNSNKEYDCKNINTACLKSVIKIQKWIKFHIKIKKIKLIQKALRQLWYNRKINKYINHNDSKMKKPLVNKCHFISKKYKNNKFMDKVIFIQKYFIEYLAKKAQIKKKSISFDCYISKTYKNRSDVKYIIIIQRKIRKYMQKIYIKNKLVNYLNYFDNKNKNMELSSSAYNKALNYKKYPKNIPNIHQRNKDLCNFESYGNSSYCNIANEDESNNKKIRSINENDSINSLYINRQNPKRNIKCFEKINHKYDCKSNKSKNSSYKSSNKAELSNEYFHNIPKCGDFEIHKYSKYINYDSFSNERYNEDSSYLDNNNNNNQNNIKDISFISPFVSLDNDEDNFYFTFVIKEIFVKNLYKKIIQELKIVHRRFYIMKFVMILIQRILKSLNQYIFFNIFKINNSKKIKMKSCCIYFNVLKRLVSANKSYFPNEIQILIKNNIPLCLNSKRNAFFISYIKPEYESNLINRQLFLNNNNLTDFVQSFLNDEKKKIFNKGKINKYIQQNKLNNRNIFTLIRYIDSLYEYLINNSIINNYKNKLKMNINENIDQDKKNEFKENLKDIEKFGIMSDRTSCNAKNVIKINNTHEHKSNEINNSIIKDKDCKTGYELINTKKYKRKGGRCINSENENSFLKDNDFFVSNQDINKRKNNHISIMDNKVNP